MIGGYLCSGWKVYIVSVAAAVTITRLNTKDSIIGKCHNSVVDANFPRHRLKSYTTDAYHDWLIDLDARVCSPGLHVHTPRNKFDTFHTVNYSQKRLQKQNDLQQSHDHLLQEHQSVLLSHLHVFLILVPTDLFTICSSALVVLTICQSYWLYISHLPVLVAIAWLLRLLVMGNEGSVASSEGSTPISDNLSLYSIYSRVRSSVESTRAPSPMEVPEPDLSHLTSDEIAQIRSVMERARNIQQEESSRARDFDEEYSDLLKLSGEMSGSECSDAGVPLCSVCGKAESTLNHSGSRTNMNMCVDCEKMVSSCSYSTFLTMPNNVMVSSMDTSIISSVSQASSRGSRESSEQTGESSWSGSRCGGDSGLSMDLGSLSTASSQNSELARQVYEQSRVKGILLYMMGPCGPGATLPKSESDEFSDLTSDLEFDELMSERNPLDGGSSEDVFIRDPMTTNVSSQTEAKPHRHRPMCLTLSGSYIHPSSIEEDGSAGGNRKTDHGGIHKHKFDIKTKSVLLDDPTDTEYSVSSLHSLSSNHQETRNQPPNLEYPSKNNSGDLVSLDDLADLNQDNNSTSHRSPTWLANVENQTCSSEELGLYESKNYGSLSAVDMIDLFRCPELCHSDRKSLVDYSENNLTTNFSITDNGQHRLQATERPSATSPHKATDSFVNTSGDKLFPGKSVSNGTSGSKIQHPDFHSIGTMTHSAPVMDLASLATNVANSTASLTCGYASHSTNVLSQISYDSLEESQSPDSADSVDSICSPLSPECDGSSNPAAENLDQEERAEISCTSADFNNSKRQKVRQPSTDWSPVVDLSPIPDVSPSVEEAEQEDMLARRMEELERQRSREQSASDDFDFTECEKLVENSFSDSTTFHPGLMPDLRVVARIPQQSSIKTLKPQLSEEHAGDDVNETSTLFGDGSCPYITTLKRCGNHEDISLLGSPEAISQEDMLADDTDIHDFACDFPFYSCTTQPQTLPHSSPCISLTHSVFPTSVKHVEREQKEEQGSKRLRDLESLITDEIHKITENMEIIARRSDVDVKPNPPPKPRRRLSDPEFTTLSGETICPEDLGNRLLPSKTTELLHDESSNTKEFFSETVTSCKYLPRQDSIERRKAKDMKARPSPILVRHIESEEQVVSPHYKVMESPFSPDTKAIINQTSDSMSVIPSSSPNEDVYIYSYPSPVTSPDSDSSPPKPHSPSLPETQSYMIPEQDKESVQMLGYVFHRNEENSFYRSTIPYNDAKSCYSPTATDPAFRNLQTSNVDNQIQAVNSPSPFSETETAVKLPFLPRKNIRKFEETKIKCLTSPSYENIQDLNTQNCVQELEKAGSLTGEDSTLLVSIKNMLKLDTSPKEIAQYTEIVMYPVFEEIYGRTRSISTEPQQLSQENQYTEHSTCHRSECTDHKEDTASESATNVRAKIREFEEITRTPPQHEPHRESNREDRVMKDKRTDSGGSSSSSCSSVKTSSSRSSSDLNRSQDKDGKKIRRKLPPIPIGEEPVLVPRSRSRRGRTPKMVRGEGVDQDDSELGGGDIPARKEQSRASSRHEAGYFDVERNHTNLVGCRSRHDLLNEEERKVVTLTATRDQTLPSKIRTQFVDAGKSKSLDFGESSRARAEASEAARIKQRIQRTASLGYGPKDETDEIIDSLISIYGIPCTEAMKCLKKRLQKELRRVTRDRKRKLEELEEIRALQMQIGALKLESETYARSKLFLGQRAQAQHLQGELKEDGRKRGGAPSHSPPQITPRRQRHKRQSSDPMVSKFSPIKEDKDIEIDFQNRLQAPLDYTVVNYLADDSVQSGLSDSDSTRSEPIRDARYNKIKPLDYARIFYIHNRGSSSTENRLNDFNYSHGYRDDIHSLSLSVSHSDQLLSSHTRTSVFYSDEEEAKAREEKKALLQYEIQKRKQQLEETARLKHELLKLARSRQSLAYQGCDDIPLPYRAYNPSSKPLPVGIIKPIDDDSHHLYDLHNETGQRLLEHSRERSRERSREGRDESDLDFNNFREDALENLVMPEHRSRDLRRHHYTHQDTEVASSYSSTEYLAHKQVSASRRYLEESSGSQGWISGDHSLDSIDSAQAYSQPAFNAREDSSQSLTSARKEAARKEPGIVSSVTLPNIHSNLTEKQPRLPYREVIYHVSDTDGSPAGDFTPAMPLLGDVKAKSRTILRNIGSGSRPVSEEFSLGEVEELMNAMYRVESDNSVDADEPIMKHMTEGGVTILKQIDRKRRPAPLEPRRYSFPVKRILVTRDSKDKSITGSGLGMKIVGGKRIPGIKELGAYVADMYSIVADQLHGELDVGDQVLEWNGVHLTGMTCEEVQDVISQTNGEIEMVVRVQTPPLSQTCLSVHPDSCRSSYDSLNQPVYEDTFKDPSLHRPRAVTNRQGVDPRQLVAQLEGIQESFSPAENSPSSSKSVTTPSVSSPCSTPRSDPTSTSSDRQQRPVSSTAAAAVDRTDRDADKLDRHLNKQRRGHSPVSEKCTQQQHSQKQLQHQQQSTQPKQQPQQQLTSSHHHQQSKTEVISVKATSSSKAKVEKRKQRKTTVPPLPSVQDKPRPSVVVDQSDNDTCSSPAFNDRQRASPPLDYRLSVRSRGSKKGKDNFIFPSKSLPETEKGEDFGLGEIQLQISQDDFDNTLNIHVIQARNLRPRDLNGQSDPFAKLYLLPGRGPENKRRTKHIARTLNPKWHQTVMFQDVARLELQNKVLEITVWDYDRFKANDFLGELIIELREHAFLDNKPHWYPLKEHVVMHSFELPKSTVPPPKLTDNGQSKSGSPRPGKKLGVSSLHPRESNGRNCEDSPRRRSLGTLNGNGTDQTSRPTTREVYSATNSPLPSRRSVISRSPIKTRTKGPLHS